MLSRWNTAQTGVLAQGDLSDQSRGWGYGFFAPGGASGYGTTPTLHVGGGGEGIIYKGLGIGAEVGYLAPARAFPDGFGVFSTNESYHFLRSASPHKLVPFVTAGYSLGFRSGTANLLNFGGGVNYWMRDRVGLRLEFRDHVSLIEGLSSHLWGFRIGLTFR